MDATAVARYLKENPAFFEDYADLIAEIFVPHPHGGHAIPDRRAADRHAARKEHRAREPAARADQVRRRERPDRREAPSLHARALRGARPRDDARGALPQPQGRFRRAAGASRLWGRVPEQSYLPELAATTLELREYADQIGAPYCGPQAPFESRDWFERGDAWRSFAFLPLRTAHTFGLLGLASEDPERFYAGHGHRLSHAARGARERRDGALPAAGLRPRAMPGAMTKTTPPDSRLASRRAGQPVAARGVRASLAARPAHTRTAYVRDASVLAAAAAGSRARESSRRAICGGFSRRCMAAGSRVAASRGCCRRGARSTASCRSATRRLKDNPCTGLRPPRSRAPVAGRALARRGGPPRQDRRHRPARAARPRAVRARVLVGPAARRARRASTSIASISSSGEVRVWGKGAKERIVPVGAAARAAIRAWLPVRAALAAADPKALFLGRERRADLAARDRAAPRRLGGEARASPSTCIRTCCGTRSPRTCCSRRATCARCRRCWATRASRRPRSTPTSTSRRSRRRTTARIRAPSASRGSTRCTVAGVAARAAGHPRSCSTTGLEERPLVG